MPLLQCTDDPPKREALADARAAREEEAAARERHGQCVLLVRIEAGGGVEEGRRRLRRSRRRGGQHARTQGGRRRLRLGRCHRGGTPRRRLGLNSSRLRLDAAGGGSWVSQLGPWCGWHIHNIHRRGACRIVSLLPRALANELRLVFVAVGESRERGSTLGIVAVVNICAGRAGQVASERSHRSVSVT